MFFLSVKLANGEAIAHHVSFVHHQVEGLGGAQLESFSI
jgi:hypothetical protein